MPSDFDTFRTAITTLIALRRERLAALPLPEPDLQAELEDLETEYLALVGGTTDADKAEIGDFYREALNAFGSSEEISSSTRTWRGCCWRCGLGVRDGERRR